MHTMHPDREGRIVLTACGAAEPFAGRIVASLDPARSTVTASVIAIGDERQLVARTTARIREALDAGWVAPLPLTRIAVASSWSAVAIDRSAIVAVTADRAEDAIRMLAGHPLWTAALDRLASGGDLVAFGPAAAALGTAGADGETSVDGLGLVPFGVIVVDPAESPQGGRAIAFSSRIDRSKDVLVLDGDGAVRWNHAGWRVIGSEAVHARIDGRWLGADPGMGLPLPAPVMRTMPYTAQHQLGKPA